MDTFKKHITYLDIKIEALGIRKKKKEIKCLI